ncbi:hypothetical protein VAEKB19_3280117 [Vibrio aestuarianus]|nr:hypothetical protein VAEKB19_3280117 [Vibrio aestuarianus]
MFERGNLCGFNLQGCNLVTLIELIFITIYEWFFINAIAPTG